MKKKLFFVNQKQFGYHINFVQYCKQLKNDFDIIYLSWDYGKDRITEEGIDIRYVSRQGNVLQRNARFVNRVFKLMRGQHYHCIFVNYFRGCSIIPLFYKNKYWIHLNIVTGSVSSKTLSRNLNNLFLRFESHFFESVSVISKGLQKLLKIKGDVYILPLGANPTMVNRQLEHKLSLLYIGALGRRIDDTVTGLALFLRKHPAADIHYVIIGEGWGNEREQIRDKVIEYKLEKYVELKGYIPHHALKQYYERANAGICYIPVIPMYEFQPATKTYEYLMAGMPVIATNTFENRQMINEQNGIIIDDNPESFAHSLELLYDKVNSFDETLIRASVAEHKWVTIVSKLKEFICTYPESSKFQKQKNKVWSDSV